MLDLSAEFRRFVPTVLALVLAASGVMAQTVPVTIPDPEERDRMLGIAEHRPDGGVREPLPTLAPVAADPFDVTHYLIDLDFDGTTETISGSVTMTATSQVNGLSTVQLDLLDNMTVSRVTQLLTIVPYTHQNDVVEVTLTSPVNSGQSFQIRVFYSGSPESGGFGTFGWNKYGGSGQGDMAWSLSEPEGARNWWPCKDQPNDKALVEERWTVKGDWIATGNGTLTSTVTLPDGRKRYTWIPTDPLTTYLVSIAATDFVSFSDSYTPIAGGSMPVDYYVYAELLADAQVSFSATVPILTFFAETFGEYAFVEDKYGMSAFPCACAMEHSTNTSYAVIAINGNNFFDWLNAHEIAHQWWGDSISPEVWADIWLNEGFASYCEALWAEHVSDSAAYRDYMDSMYRENFNGPLYDNESLFGSTVYNKGAWVVHMLRGVMGDTDFFQSLRDWYQSRQDGTGNTAQFQANQEAVYGGPMDWFFDQWVYNANRPVYEYGFTTADLGNGTFRNYVRINQVQGDAGIFTMPIDLTLVTPSGSEIREVWNDAAVQDFVLDTTEALTGLLFDEADWILKDGPALISIADGDADGVPDTIDNCNGISNPAQTNSDGDTEGDACDDDDDNDLLLDVEDCAPTDPESGLPAEVALLTVDGNLLSWTSAARADSYDVVRGLLSQLDSGYGSCLATGITALSYADGDLAPSGDGFLYLIRGHDAGCGGPGSLGSDSAGTPRAAACP